MAGCYKQGNELAGSIVVERFSTSRATIRVSRRLHSVDTTQVSSSVDVAVGDGTGKLAACCDVRPSIRAAFDR